MHSPSNRRRTFLRVIVVAAVLLALAWLTLGVVVQPSNQRNWATDQAQLPIATFDGDHVRIRNVRNAHYRAVDDFDVRWETRDVDLSAIESVWFVVEPFSDWRGPAHTFLSFGFADGEYLAISVEIRKERGESFSPLLGLLRQYELTYVVGDEHDLIGLRANHRHDDVYLYPMHATPDARRALFVAMLERANRLAQSPEFYNTLTSNCTSNIVDHVNALAPDSVGFSLRTVLPAYSDELAYDLGLIDTDLPRETFRAVYRINDAAARHADDAGFSQAIRAALPPRNAMR